MFPLCTLLVAVSTALLASCAGGPQYHRPDAPLPSQYLNQTELKQSNTARLASFDIWWQEFDDPLLSQFVSDAQARASVATFRAAGSHQPPGPRRPDFY